MKGERLVQVHHSRESEASSLRRPWHLMRKKHSNKTNSSIPSKQGNIQKMTETNAIGHPTLKPKHPVPSDIDVSQQIVKEVGLLDIATLAKE